MTSRKYFAHFVLFCGFFTPSTIYMYRYTRYAYEKAASVSVLCYGQGKW